MMPPTAAEILRIVAQWRRTLVAYANNTDQGRESELSRAYEQADRPMYDLDPDHLEALADVLDSKAES